MSTMAKSREQKNARAGNPGLLASMLQAGLYKPLQGRIVRQVSFVAIAVVALLIAWDVSAWTWLAGAFNGARYAFGLLLSVSALWVAYRLVNYPPFADFLIAVEAEMNKVSWPAWPELWKASVVVIFVIFSMAISLWVFDLLWSGIFWFIGVR